MTNFILGIESSCDETSAAVLKQTKGEITILSNIVASSANLQAKYGGVIPEQAAREQLKAIIPVVKEALQSASITPNDLNSIAVTYGPGLIGPLLIGVETAKTLALVWDKPLIPVNHLIGHFYANWIKTSQLHTQPTFPTIGLLVSGGHTDLVLFSNHMDYQYLGGTRDDAAGECFDKCARLLNLPYPGGPQLSKLSIKGNSKAFNFPRPMLNSVDFDFSFSGLKTSVTTLVNQSKSTEMTDLSASIQQAIIDVLVHKTLKASQKFNCSNLLIAGGVAANAQLRETLESNLKQLFPKTTFHVPQPALCTDNAAMIAAAAFFLTPLEDPLKLQANPNLNLALNF